MTEQYAGLSLGVDVSQVDNAVKSLDNFAKANDTAAKGVESFVNQEQVARQKAKEFGATLRLQREEFEGVAAAIDPTLTKMKSLATASQKLDTLWKNGIVDDEEFFKLGEMLETQNNALAKSRAALTEEGRAAAEAAAAKNKLAKEGATFIRNLEAQAMTIGKTKDEILAMKAAQLGVSDQAAPFIKQLGAQTESMKLAGLSAGQYNQAMRMLPAQITDVVTSLASGMPVWLVAIQQGGQIKDSFGGIGNTFKVLLGYLNPVNVGMAAVAASLGALAIAVYNNRKEIDAATKAVRENLGMTGDYADKLALNIRNIASEAGKTAEETAGMFINTKDGATEAIGKLIDIGMSYDDARREVEKYKGAADFTNVNTLIEDHKLRIAGLKDSWSDAAEEAKNYYTGANLGRQNTALGGAIDYGLKFVAQALDLEKEVNDARIKGNKIVADTAAQIEKEYYASNRVAGAEKALADARKAANTIRFSDNEKAKKQAEDLIAIRKRELKEAQDADKKKNSPKKSSTGAVVKSPTEQLDRELYTLQAQLKTLKEHAGINDKISAQRKALWATEATISVLEETQGKRKLTNQEKALLVSQKQVLELANQKAELGDQIQEQERLNELSDKSLKFVTSMTLASKALNDTRAMGNREAQRELERQKITSDYLAAGGGENDTKLKEMIDAQNEYYANEDAKRSDWLAGAENAFANYGDAATDMYSNVGSIASSALNGMSDMMTEFLMTGQANFADFAKSIISQIIKMITQMVIFNSISGMMGGGMGGFSFAQGSYSSGGYTGDGAKYDTAGIVHKGEFVMTKEATQRIGVSNLYKMMRGYASGGLVGGGGSSTAYTSSGGGAGLGLSIGSIPVSITNGSDNSGLEQGIRALFTQLITEECSQGGSVKKLIDEKTGG